MKGVETEAGMKEKQRIKENIVARKEVGLAKDVIFCEIFCKNCGIPI